MARRPLLTLLSFVVVCLTCAAQSDPQADLEGRVKALEEELAKMKAGGGTESVTWKDLTALGGKFRLYGFLRADAIYDDSRPNNTQTIAWIRSEDPTAPPTIGAKDNDSDFTLHARLTRVGLDFFGPKIDGLGGAVSGGKVEVDFYNNGLQTQAESRAALRMRHAYVTLQWTDFRFLAGQTTDVISPIYPIVNNDLVMWGAGNLGDRRPQLRGDWTPAVGPGNLIWQGEVGLSGADDNQDLDAAGTTGAGYRDGETSGLPTLQMRLAYKFPMIEKQNFEFGVWVDRAWEEPDTAFNGKTHFDSYAYGADLTLPVYKDVVWVKGEVWTGENVDDVRGGIFQGINTTTGDEIGSKGGFVEVGYKAMAHATFYAGISRDNPDNDDLPMQGRAANKIWYLATRLNFKPVEMGFEYLNWITEYKGLDQGDDNRFQFFISYSF